MNFQKMQALCKKQKKASFYRAPYATLICIDGGEYYFENLVSISNPKEMAIIFGIDEDKLSRWSVDFEKTLPLHWEGLGRNGRGGDYVRVPLDRYGSVMIGGVKMLLFRKKQIEQLSLEEEEDNFSKVSDDFDIGIISVEPEKLMPISGSGIFSYEYIYERDGKKAYFGVYSSDRLIALIKPLEITDGMLSFIDTYQRELRRHISFSGGQRYLEG